MKKLFSSAQLEVINAAAEKSKQLNSPPVAAVSKGMSNDIQQMSQQVVDYFKDSTAILISSPEELHEYISDLIDAGIAGIDTETTGLDRIHDHIVGASLYYPGGTECYIPMKHLVPLFDEPYRGQLTYDQVSVEFQRLAESDVKLVFANADFDLSMIYKDLKADLIPRCYYDVILAWRCLKENEKDNSLKTLYTKYVLKGKGDPKKFSDFFTPALFPYCKPEVAKLYAANDAKITYELYQWQLPFVTKTNPKCQKHHLEAIADLIWNIEFPLMAVCQNMHRRGLYLDRETARVLSQRYSQRKEQAYQELGEIVSGLMIDCDYNTLSKSPFRNGATFNPNSTTHVQYLLRNILKLDIGKSVDKHVLEELNLPVTKKILEVRNLLKLISTYIDKLPNATTTDGKIHAVFKSIGAATGRFSSEAPNMQNIPSHAGDIRHMFRATPEQTHIIDMEDTVSSVTVELSSLVEVSTDTGRRKVSDLQIGDIVELLHDNLKQMCKLVGVEETPSGRLLTFAKEDT